MTIINFDCLLYIVSLKQFKGPIRGPFIYDRRNMLTKDIQDKGLYKDMQDLMDSLSLDVVEVNTQENKGDVQLRVFLSKKSGEITTDDLENAYNIIYPRYSVLMRKRELTLEVTSPGLQRNLKDWHEFELFIGKDVRVYSTAYSSYVVGTIDLLDGDTLTLRNYLIEDKNEKGDSIALDYKDIAKAKLEYRWEGRNA